MNDVSDPELGYLLEPKQDELIVDRERKVRAVTDRLGFNNADDTLYSNADVVTVGDSFTMGRGAGYGNSWPRQLAEITGLRVLNLGVAGWDVYQFPRVLERYGPGAAPSTVVIGLVSFNDLRPTYYQYQDYRQSHDEVKGFREFSRKKVSWASLRGDRKNYLAAILEATTFAMPYTATTALYFVNLNPLAQPPLCEFTIAGTRMEIAFTALRQLKDDQRVLHLDRVSADLIQTAEFVETLGAQPYFVYMPYPEEVYVPLLESATSLNQCAREVLNEHQSGKFNWNNYYDQYADALGPYSDQLSNVTPFLQHHAAKGEQQNWIFDLHPNPLGHQRIAEFVAETIEK